TATPAPASTPPESSQDDPASRSSLRTRHPGTADRAHHAAASPASPSATPPAPPAPSPPELQTTPPATTTTSTPTLRRSIAVLELSQGRPTTHNQTTRISQRDRAVERG